MYDCLERHRVRIAQRTRISVEKIMGYVKLGIYFREEILPDFKIQKDYLFPASKLVVVTINEKISQCVTLP